jgi:predicted ferric reductase
MSFDPWSTPRGGLPSFVSIFLTACLVAAGVVVGALAAVIVLPIWLPALGASIHALDPKAYWYLSRSSGFVAFGLLWLSMVFGLLITNRMARLWPGGFTAFDLHQFASLLGLALTVFHGLILIGDHYLNYTLAQLVIPFGSVNYRPVWVGLGQIGTYGLIIVTLSFYLRRRMGPRGWRLVHGLSYAGFLLALLHGLFSGTDSGSLGVLAFYWITAVSTLALTVYRIVVSRQARQARPARGLAAQ